MKGSTFLKVTGILMIVFGTLALVLAIIAVAAVALASSLCVLSTILTLVGDPDSFSIISVLIGLVLPVLYLIGSFQNKKLRG